MLKKYFYNISTSFNYFSGNPGRFSVRLCHKTIPQSKSESSTKHLDIIRYLESSPDYEDIMDQIPLHLLKKYKDPENLYLINNKTAREIVNAIKDRINSSFPIIEVNPGFGFLTEELLKCQRNHVYMYETDIHFPPYLSKLQDRYSERTTLKFGDFFGMWKLAYQDKNDSGNRVEKLLGDLYTKDALSTGINVNIIGSMPGQNFIRRLIINVIFNKTTNQLVKPEFFVTMPCQHYKLLIDHGIHKKILPSLFQLLFDVEILTSVPRLHFLPWTSSSKVTTSMDEHRLYLVHIRQKERLPCLPEHLPLLWYFFKPQTFTKCGRVIPLLEQWIPGCGVWLITGQDPPDTNKKLAPQDGDAKLPHMTIFTRFQDLNLQQRLTLFKTFISWPEFEQCQFREMMETNLSKVFAPYEDEKDRKTIPTDMEDIEHSDSENETQ